MFTLKQFDDYCFVARDEINNIVVSTVWLGIDHQHLPHLPDHPPVIFETMTFSPVWDQWDACLVERYGTEDRALAEHAAGMSWHRSRPAPII